MFFIFNRETRISSEAEMIQTMARFTLITITYNFFHLVKSIKGENGIM